MNDVKILATAAQELFAVLTTMWLNALVHQVTLEIRKSPAV